MKYLFHSFNTITVRKTWEIIKREYFTRVRKKTFILLTVLGPLLIVAISLIPILLANAGKKDQLILVKDESGMFNALADSAGIYFSFQYKDVPFEELKKSFSAYPEQFDALLFIPKSIQTEHPYGIELYSSDQVSITTRSYIENLLADQFEEMNLKARNLKREDILSIRPDVVINDRVLSGETEIESDAAAATAIGYIMGFLTYIVLLIYGSMVMRGVMEEKTSRVVEVIISSVRPFQLMLGKIIGIGLVGMTQFLIWGILVFIFNFIAGILFIDEFMQLQQSNPGQMQGDAAMFSNMITGLEGQHIYQLLFLFAVYFLGGFFLYASLFAGAGSLASEDDGSDVQAYALPLTLMVVVSLFIMMTVVQQPDSQLAFWASIIPFTSPIVMPSIIPFHPPLWQILLSILLLIGGFLFTTYLAGRIYRVGILMYGKKIKLREVIRWMFASGY